MQCCEHKRNHGEADQGACRMDLFYASVGGARWQCCGCGRNALMGLKLWPAPTSSYAGSSRTSCPSVGDRLFRRPRPRVDIGEVPRRMEPADGHRNCICLASLPRGISTEGRLAGVLVTGGGKAASRPGRGRRATSGKRAAGRSTMIVAKRMPLEA